MKKITAYVHSHWDREWYREFEEFRLRLIEVFDDVLAALKSNELPCFYFDGQTAAMEDYLEIFPEKLEDIKKLIKEKKLRIGPFYCSTDSFLVSGEMIYRNLEIGIKKSKELGETDFIGYLSDTFGHSRCIPYIFKALGIDKACLWRGLGDLPADINWQGIRAVYLIQGYFQDFLNSDLTIEKKAELLKKYIDKIALKSSDNILLPIGADHLAIPDNLKEQIKNLNKIYSDYKIKLASPFEYFEKIKSRTKTEGEFLDNSLNFILPGVYSARIYIKQANAKSRQLLNRIAEPLQAIGNFYFSTKNKQNEIDYAYKTLIKNHAHDSIYGCSTDKVADEVMMRFKNVDSVSNGIIKRTIRDLSSSKGNFAIINLSNYEYSGIVKYISDKTPPKWLNAVKIKQEKGFTDEKLYNISQIPVTEDYTTINEYIVDVKNLSPFSLTSLKQENICSDKFLKISDKSIENEYIKAEVENGRIIITDKIKNEKYNDFIHIIDRADTGDSYNFGPLQKDKIISANLKKFKIKNIKDKIAALSLFYKIKIPANSTEKNRSSKTYLHRIKLDLILYNQSKYLEFNTEWENKSKNHILQIRFNLKEKIFKTINEDLYGTTERYFDPDYDIYKQLPAPRGKELKPNTSPMQRFMIAENFALITKGNQEYEIIKNSVNLTLLRATGIISNPKNSSRGTPAGPPLPIEKAQCLGNNRAKFAIIFSKNEQEIFKTAEEFYSPCICLNTNIKSTKFIEIPNKNILIYSIKLTKEGIQYRLFNNSNKKQSVKVKIPDLKYEKEIFFNSKEIKNIVINR